MLEMAILVSIGAQHSPVSVSIVTEWRRRSDQYCSVLVLAARPVPDRDRAHMVSPQSRRSPVRPPVDQALARLGLRRHRQHAVLPRQYGDAARRRQEDDRSDRQGVVARQAADAYRKRAKATRTGQACPRKFRNGNLPSWAFSAGDG